MFWNKKKPSKKALSKRNDPNPYGAIRSVPIIPEPRLANTALTRKQTSEQVFQRMGGAEAIAAVIRTMMAEDAIRRRQSSPSTQAEEENV